jgi:hypothetical protein
MKSPPAVRNLKVAIATGDIPSRSVALTTTNELPQKVIRHNIRNALNGLIVLAAMLASSLASPNKGFT